MGRQRERGGSFIFWFILAMSAMAGWSQAKLAARSFIWVSHLGGRAQGLQANLCCLHRGGEGRTQTCSLWDAGAAGGSLILGVIAGTP